MRPFEWLVPVIAPTVMTWQESGENPALFCYLIGWGTYMTLRSRATAPIPLAVRHEVPCSNSSSTCSTLSMM